jgi:C1A family cysteine protease
MKLLRTEVILFVALLVTMMFIPIAGATGDELQAGPLNPEFIKYLKEKPYDSQVQIGTHGLGLIPSPIYRPDVKDVQMFGSNKMDSYSAKFDLRDSGKVSPVKNQNPFGTCWAFASYASLESTSMPATPAPDFSEKNIVNLAGFSLPGNPQDAGGNTKMSTAYLTRWNGPVDSVTDSYPTSTTGWTTSSTYPPVKHVQNVAIFPGRTSRTDNNNIKGALTRWGAVSSSLYWYDTFYSSTYTSYYQPASAAGSSSGHAVTIVGWDDNYEATNFTTTAYGPGAWIVKNSWGSAWGSSGYFYVSYYDKSFGSVIQPDNTYKDTAVFLGESTSNYNKVYSYDKLGEVSDYSYGPILKSGSFANVFTATSSETIKAVGFYTTDLNVLCTIKIYKNPTSGPVGETPAATFSGTIPYMGYNTVELPSSQQVPVTAGDKFSVIVTVTNPTNKYNIPIEMNSNGYTSGIVSQYGQGYLFGRNGWNDLKTELDNSHVCVKAYTSSKVSTVDNVGVFRNGVFYRDGTEAIAYGLSTDIPVTGDWDGEGLSEVSVFRDGVFYRDGAEAIAYGLSTDIPVTGDWNGDLKSEVGVYRNGIFYRDGAEAIAYGLSTDTPVTGDWNGDLISEVGVFRNGIFYRYGTTEIVYGLSTDTPVTGDWDGNGLDEVGVFREGVFYRDGADAIVYGLSTDKPVTGDWM